ncbi:MAG: amino acid ABC transporter permease [Clostridia bacterium]|nr:amino acid ABC transporter permease [Clostridia bacterium]
MIQFFIDVWEIITNYGELLLQGVGNTLLIALVGTVFGLIIGLLIGILRTTAYSKKTPLRILHKIANGICACYIEIFRGTPMMVQAMIIFWGYAFASGGNTLPLVASGIFIVSINTGAYMAEIVRGGIISIDKGQFEGAQSIGMSHFQTMTHIVIPQVMRNILPSISNEFVINIKDTSVLNVIGVMEIYYFAEVIAKLNLEIFQTYFVICVMYFILTFSVTKFLRFCEKKLEGGKSYTIFGSQSSPEAEIKVKGGN